MKNLKRFIENIYLGFRFAKILTKRQNYADLKASGDKMRKPKQGEMYGMGLRITRGQAQASPEQLAEWQSKPWNSLANSQEAINFGKR